MRTRVKKQGGNSRAKTGETAYQIVERGRKRVGVFPNMDSLAYLNLELANQPPPAGEQNADSNKIGASWEAAGWDEIFNSLDAEEEEEE